MQKYTLAALAVVLAAALIFYVVYFDKSSQLESVLSEEGFIELRPPSTLLQPGALVEIQSRNPLRVSTICSAQSSLALTPEQVAVSTSVDSSVLGKESASFSLNLSSLGIGRASSAGKAVKSATVKLSNVRLIELSDAEIVRNIAKRDSACAEALKVRFDTNRDSLTLIDTVLIADAEITLDFDGSVTSTVAASEIEGAFIAGQFNFDFSDASRALVLGKDLVWGVKDDQTMAWHGLTLPNTGSNGDNERSIMKGAGAIEQLDLSREARASFSDFPLKVRYDVLPLKQASPEACWATVFTMMESWKQGKPLDVATVINGLGAPYTDYLRNDTGLPGGSERTFVARIGLSALPPASYPLSTFRNILREKGPIWVIVGDGISSHALLLVGIYGYSEEESGDTYHKSFMEFVDPASGTFQYATAFDFLTRFEQEAAFIVNRPYYQTDLRWQVLTF
jgi:hypothetical protein